MNMIMNGFSFVILSLSLFTGPSAISDVQLTRMSEIHHGY